MELTTKRLLLRPFRPEDESQFMAFADDPLYRRFLGNNHPTAAQLVENNVLADREREPSWVIVLAGRAIGSIFLGVHAEDKAAELACMLSPEHWGQGIALEAGRAVVDYAFRELGLEKVYARAQANNDASRRAMEKGGMTQEGLLRSHRIDASGNRFDEVVFGVTRDGWERNTQPASDA
jgi:RimJ/RimL family protein N-acetyltransferase